MKTSWLDVGKGMDVLGSIALRSSIEVKREGGRKRLTISRMYGVTFQGVMRRSPRRLDVYSDPYQCRLSHPARLGYYTIPVPPSRVSTIIIVSLPSNAISAPREMCVVSHCDRQSNSFVKVSSLPDASCSLDRRWSGRKVCSGKYRTGHVIQYPFGRAQTTLLTTLCPVPQRIREMWSVGSMGYARCFVRF
jgi:hypothetical protein